MDAHEDNPTLSHILAPGAVVGLQQVLTGRAKFSDAVWTDVDQHLDFLPYGEAEANIDTQWPEFVGAMAAAPEFVGAMAAAAGLYAWIILDLPPLASGAEVRAAGAIVDGLLFVVARGRTQESSIEEELRFLGPVRDKLFWVVINDAPPHLSRQRLGSGKQSSPCWPERPGSRKQGTSVFRR